MLNGEGYVVLFQGTQIHDRTTSRYQEHLDSYTQKEGRKEGRNLLDI